MSTVADQQASKFLEQLTRLRKFSGGGKVALHKPVTLLYALSEIAHGKAETIRYRAAESVIAPVLAKFGPPGKRTRVADPFARLEGDGFWKLRTTHRDEIFDKSGNARPGQLHKYDVEAGFDEEIVKLLRVNPSVVAEAVKVIVEAHVPSSISKDVLHMVGWEARPYVPIGHSAGLP